MCSRTTPSAWEDGPNSTSVHRARSPRARDPRSDVAPRRHHGNRRSPGSQKNKPTAMPAEPPQNLVYHRPRAKKTLTNTCLRLRSSPSPKDVGLKGKKAQAVIIATGFLKCSWPWLPRSSWPNARSPPCAWSPMPSTTTFDKQDVKYKKVVLPAGLPRHRRWKWA